MMSKALAHVLLAIFPVLCLAEPAEIQSGVRWEAERLLPVFAAPRALDVADLHDSSGDLRLLMATLQGIINRSEPRIYLFENAEEGKETWLNDLKIPREIHPSPWDVFAKYRQEVKGIIVYDPEMADTVNIATTLAGIHDAVVASPELAEKLTAEPYQLPLLHDLRGKFNSRLEAYTWQHENLSTATTRRMVVGLSPGRATRPASALPESFSILAADTTRERGGRNRRTRSVDLTAQLGKEHVFLRFDDAFPRDGWGPAVRKVSIAADGETIASFTPGTPQEEAFLYHSHQSRLGTDRGGFRFADQGAHFVYRFSPSAGTKKLTASVEVWNQYRISASSEAPDGSRAWRAYGFLRDYAVANRAMVVWLDANDPAERALFEKILSDLEKPAPYVGWFGDDIEGEFSGVELASRHGAYVVPADWFNNLTVFSGTRLEAIEESPLPTPPLENKIYVTWTFGEGDNLQYTQHRMRVLWDDPARGQVPINWTASPLMIDATPAILNHYRRTATANDCIVAGPSGVGYFYPQPWPDAGFAEFLQRTYPYVEKSGMTIPYVLNRADHKNLPLSAEEAAAYRDAYRAPGVLLGWGDDFGLEITAGGLPVSTIRGVSTVEQGLAALNREKLKWDGKSPLFLSVGLFAWNLRPAQVAEMARGLGPEFEVVRADHYFSLIREAHPAAAAEF